MNLTTSRDGSESPPTVHGSCDGYLTGPLVTARRLRRTLESAHCARPDDLSTADRPGDFELRVLDFGDGPASGDGRVERAVRGGEPTRGSTQARRGAGELERDPWAAPGLGPDHAPSLGGHMAL